MPRRREGPTRNKQTGYYFFDEYVGIEKDKRVNLQTSQGNSASCTRLPALRPYERLEMWD